MQIREITEKKIWDEFVTAQPEHSFLQSWTWGDFSVSLGDRAIRLGVYAGHATDDNKLRAVALTLVVRARRGSFYFIPHGPVIANEQEHWAVLDSLFAYLRERASKDGIAFIRISPQLIDTPELRAQLARHKFRSAPMHMHAERSWLLDISPNEKTLLAGMRKVNRYNIKKAQREGVRVTQSDAAHDLEQFHKLFDRFANKKHFVPFSKEYLMNEFAVFAKDNQISLFIAKHKVDNADDQILGMAMIIFYGTTGFYHQSLSTGAHPHKQASYLMLWEAIREAKKRGCTTFNFWGIAPRDDSKRPTKRKHPWAGLTFFKTGFGGYERNYIHAHDLPLTVKYWVNYLIETIRRVKRGF